MKRSKKPKQKVKISLLPTYLTIVGVFLLMLSGALTMVYLNSQKKYDPALENKLEMKIIPSDIKNKLVNAPTSANFRVPVLLYHYVEYVQDKKDTTRQSLDTMPDVFESQLTALENAGYTFMTASQLGQVLDGKAQMPKNPILLTFDDGHRDFYTDAFPILKKDNIKSTAFIITGFLGGADFMDNYQVQEIANSGIVEIGDHTIHHVYMKGKSLKTDENEVNGSKEYLENNFKVKVVSFAYPYGAFDERAIDVIKKAGFTTAVSTLPGIIVNNSDRYFIERIRPGERSGESLVKFLENYQQPSETSAASE